MGRQTFNVGQEIVEQDFDDLQSRAERFLYDAVIYEMLQKKTDGFFQAGLTSIFQNSTSVLVKAGLGFMTDDTGAKEPIRKPLYLAADALVNLDAPDGGNARIDIIALKWKRTVSLSENRKFKDEFTEVISTQSFDVADEWDVEILYVAGVPSGSPAVPATPAGYLKVQELAVAASTGLADQSSITDVRSLLPLCTSSSVTGSNEYDKIVGDLAQVGVTHASLKLALDNSSDGEKILVLKDEAPTAIPIVTNNNIEIVYKRGVTFTKGSVITGLQIDGDDCKLVNARFKDYSTVGDKPLIINGARTYLDAPRFLNCDSNTDDQGSETFINVEYTE